MEGIQPEFYGYNYSSNFNNGEGFRQETITLKAQLATYESNID